MIRFSARPLLERRLHLFAFVALAAVGVLSWRPGVFKSAWAEPAARPVPSLPGQTLALGQPLTGSITPGQTQAWSTPALNAGALYSVDVSLDSPSQLLTPADLVPRRIASPITFNVVKDEIYPPHARVSVSFASPGNPTIAKGLWSGDPGAYFIVRAAKDGAAQMTLAAPETGSGAETDPIGFRISIRPLDVSAADAVQIAPNTARDWQHASPMTLGRTVFGTSDDIEYLYNTNEGKNGWQWLTFDYKDAMPKLVFFEMNFLDRDVPGTIKIYKQEGINAGAHLVEYTQGKDPTEIRHDDQTDELVDFKFLTRVLAPGRYYLAVKSNHPQWSLRTSLYEVPPYTDPQKAVSLAMRYMVDIGDEFFANTPRKGAVRTRAENVTDETERCITCHPAHFTMLSTLTAARNGYTISNHPEFKFMMDKLYNAPAPFYGFKNTYWLRFELAPTNGESRLGKMLSLYEDFVSHHPTETPSHLTHYLQLVYDARDKLPRADTVHYMEKFQPTHTRNYEFDGNRPISDFRVASDSWYVLHEVATRTGDASLRASARHVADLMTSTTTNDLEDRVEQIKGMVEMIEAGPSLKARFEPVIQDDIQHILAKQHDDGGWVTAEYMSNEQFFDAATRAPFEKKSDPSLQFMTGEVLYALKIAGYNMQDPRIQKAVHWLLGLQQPFGGWLDTKGELFLQPHKETCWAIIGLSSIYPERGPALAPAAPIPTESVRTSPVALAQVLNWLDQVWYDHDPKVLEAVLPFLASPEPLVRAEAAAAVGRMSVDAPDAATFQAAVRPLAKALGDRTKMVSRAAAWSMRQLGNDGSGAAIDAVKSALAAPDDYARRGAARVFYQYWYHMVPREDVARELVRHVDDPDMLVRIESLKALWRWWYRTGDFSLRRQIEQAFIERAAVQHEDPLVRLNVAQAIYNILDDNTVQFHSNWLRSIALQKDRDQAEAARIAEVERPLATELAAALEANNPLKATARQTILTALDYYFLRGGIGNDYDSITFYDHDAAETMARALLPLTHSPDTVISSKAFEALAVARESGDRDVLLALLSHLDSKDPHARDIAEQTLAKFPTGYQAYKPPATPETSAGGGSR